jgi:hypothetical protein
VAVLEEGDCSCRCFDRLEFVLVDVFTHCFPSLALARAFFPFGPLFFLPLTLLFFAIVKILDKSSTIRLEEIRTSVVRFDQ